MNAKRYDPAFPRQRGMPWIAILIVVLAILVAIFADSLVLHDPEAVDPVNSLLPPMFFDVGQPVPAGVTTAPPPTKEEIEKMLAVAPRYGIEIKLPHP